MAKKNKDYLSEKEVNQVLNAWDFLEFSKAYNNLYSGGYYTPDIVNQQMKNINMNPIDISVNEIERALSNPKSSETILRQYSENAELKDMYYKRLIRYYSDMALFNMTFDVVNAYEAKDFKSKEYKNDLRILEDFVGRFNYREEFSIVLRQLFRQGVFYCIFRDDGNKSTLQELPADFCQITGRFSHGLLFDFNMNWFIGNYGIDIDMYPPIFRKMHRKIFKNRNLKGYDPSAPVDTRNTSFVYWQQCSPAYGFWCWKINPEIANIVPYFAPLFSETSYKSIIRGLQNDKYFIEASKLLVGIVGFNKDAKSGQVANNINMTPDMLGKFLGTARQGLNKQIGLVALPMEDIKVAEFDTSDKNILNDYIKTTSKQSSPSSDVLYSDEKLNSHQSKLASAIDVNIVNSMYPMFSSFIEYYVNAKTSKYKFRIKFNDFNIPDEKTDKYNRFKDMTALGLFDIQQAARVVNMNVFELNRSLMISKSFDISNKLEFITNYAENGDSTSPTPKVGIQKKRGRPPKPESDNDNTEASNARGSNELKI